MASPAASGPPPSSAYLEQSLQGSLLGTGIAFLVLNTIFYAQRLYSRYLQSTSWGVEDWIMVFAYILAQGVCADCILSINYGVGIHFELFMAIEPQLFPSWGANSLYALPILYVVSSTLPKLSILTLYLRIITQPYLRWGCWITMAILILACIINIFTFAFQCNPIEAAWTPAIQGIYCNDILDHMTYSPITNIITDVAMLILPLPILFRIAAPKSVKIGLIFTFLLASLGLIASCARFAIFVIDKNNWDYTWVTAQMVIWTCIESSIYFISACLLMCRPLLHKITSWPPLVNACQKLQRGKSPKTSNSSSGTCSANKRSIHISEEIRKANRRNSSSLGISVIGRGQGLDEDEIELQAKGAGESARDASSLEAQDTHPDFLFAPAPSDGDAVWTRRMFYDT